MDEKNTRPVSDTLSDKTNDAQQYHNKSSSLRPQSQSATTGGITSPVLSSPPAPAIAQPGTIMLAVLPPPFATAPASLALTDRAVHNTILLGRVDGTHIALPSVSGIAPQRHVDLSATHAQPSYVLQPHVIIKQQPVAAIARPAASDDSDSTAASAQAASVGESSSRMSSTIHANFPLSPHGAATRISPIATGPPHAGWVHAGQLAFVRPDYATMPQSPVGGVPQRAPVDVLGSPSHMMSQQCANYPQQRMGPTTMHQANRHNNGPAIAVYPTGQMPPPRLPPGYMMMSGHPGLPALVQRMHNTKRARECTKPLKEWLLKNRRKPYPTRMEKAQLRDMTGLTFNQVSMWFANARRRIKKVGIESWARAALSGEDSFMLDEEWLDQDDSKVDSEEKEGDDSRAEQFTSPTSPPAFNEMQHHADGQSRDPHSHLPIKDDDETMTASSSIHHGFSPLPHEPGTSSSEFATNSSTLDYHLPGKPLHPMQTNAEDTSCFQLPSYNQDAHRSLGSLDTPRSPQNMGFVSQRGQEQDADELRELDMSAADREQTAAAARHQYDAGRHALTPSDAADQFLPRLPSNSGQDKNKGLYFYTQSHDANTMTTAPLSAQAAIPANSCQVPPLTSQPSSSLFPTSTYYGVPSVSVIQPSYVVPQHVATMSGSTAPLSSPYIPDQNSMHAQIQ